MHELNKGRGAGTGFGDELATVLLDTFGGAEETDDGILALGTLVCGVPGSLSGGRPHAAPGADPAACQRRL